MVRLRGRLLTCFYCGKRSSIRYDGHIRDFLCTFCEARNYLDEYGDVTDPPALESSTPKRFVKQLPSRPAPPTDSIFCDKCLKNQHLFTRSLAQYEYLPDDPSHPDYAELERKYFRYRKDLERRYPQICSDCDVKVKARIKDADYTAQTDILRQMMEKSRGRRVPKKMTSLDVANALGRWLWWGGFIIEIVWHLVSASSVLDKREENGMYDPDDQSATKQMIVAWSSWLRTFLPAAETLIGWSIKVGFLSAWWNPYFVQLIRGFTRHLFGFAQWYCFQGLIIFFRYIFRSVLHMQGGQAQSTAAQLSAHFAMACIMGLIYYLARGSIKVDTTPLFSTAKRTESADQKPSPVPRRKIREPKTLAEALTEALESANPSPVKTPTPIKYPPPQRPMNPLPPSRLSRQPFQPNQDELSFAGFSISDKSPQKGFRAQDPDTMDWSPLPKHAQKSQYRAFQDSPISKLGTRAFGQSPTQPDAGPFWYKVPPAPVNPAQRFRNPPGAPLFKRAFSVEPKKEEGSFSFGMGHLDDRREEMPRASSVDFKSPSFFAPEHPDDTDALADALGQSFSFASVVDDESDSEKTVVNEDIQVEIPILSSSQTSHKYDLYFLMVILPSWFLPQVTTIPYAREVQLAILAIAGIIALRSIGGATQQILRGGADSSSLAMCFASVTSVLELSAVCWIGWQLWTNGSDVFQHGASVLAFMLGHQELRGFSLRRST
ncbi:Ima1 N-terminal domain-containing protein [Trichoderma sp. SZMC 28013]